MTGEENQLILAKGERDNYRRRQNVYCRWVLFGIVIAAFLTASVALVGYRWESALGFAINTIGLFFSGKWMVIYTIRFEQAQRDLEHLEAKAQK